MANGGMSKGAAIAARAAHTDVGSAAILPLFTATLFLSALLLFWVQPMFAKMVLPLLGGAPNVWNTAMVFFQATLLAGYAYAHVATRRLTLGRQVLVHLCVIAVAAVSLPIAVADLPVGGPPIPWLLALLALSIGLPFFAVSATAPLLQKWFAASRHAHAGDPYFLYAASNLGSILALLAYPLFFEPFLRLGEQSWAWTAGYAVLLALVALAGLAALRDALPAAAETLESAASLSAGAVSWSRRAHWVALAFAPSSLLLGVTSHITTDVAAVPLLWVVPLALYLFTFVLVFARRPPLRHAWMVAAQPYVLFAAWILLPILHALWETFTLHLAVFFITAMVCHGELVRRRPAASHLTEFYLLMAFGGMLGGVFNALVAPVVFDGIYEYAIALSVACALRPWRPGGGLRALILDGLLPLLLLAVMLAVPALVHLAPKASGWFYFAFAAAIGIVVLAFQDRPLRFGLAVAAVMLALYRYGGDGSVLHQERSFFGVYRVKSVDGGAVHVLAHGLTRHGIQSTDPARRREPLGYYSRSGPLGQVFAGIERARPLHAIGLVGLGAGASLCYARPGQHWTVYEIDPVVGRLAQTPDYFTYWSDCLDPATSHIVYGDARIALRQATTARFDMLILDAYSSDAVPAHLMTRQALALYRDRLAPHGLLVFHLSNRHMRLEKVLGALVEDAGMAGLVEEHTPPHARRALEWYSVWAVVARDPADLAFLAGDRRWRPLTVPAGTDLWTDDFSNILRVLK